MDAKKDKFSRCGWITVNRNCNMSCHWCYAKSLDSSYDVLVMHPNLLFNLIELFYNCGFKKIIFIGGEPTIYPHMANAIKRCKELSLTTEIVTNGMAFADKIYTTELYSAGLDSVVFSIKGSNQYDFYKTTGHDTFNLIPTALDNIVSAGIKCTISAVLTTSFIDHIEEIFRILEKKKVNKLVFSFLKEFGKDLDSQKYYYSNTPDIILEKLYRKLVQYPSIHNEFDWIIEACIPIPCRSKNMRSFYEGHFHYSCKDINGAPLIFDTTGNLLYCNTLPNFTYGKYGVDFSTPEQLFNHLQKKCS